MDDAAAQRRSFDAFQAMRFFNGLRWIVRILLVEDDQILGSSLKKALEKHAYGVDWLRDGKSALLALENSHFVAVILDINLPELSGIGVLKGLRQKGNKVPVMMLTALDAIRQKVEGLDEGADDYIVKPFDLDELLARLRALIRRREGRTETVIRCGDVELDPSAMVVSRGGVPVHTTAKEFHLLKLLMERTGRYVTKNDIEYALYDADSTVESNTIEVAIYNLRKKLGPDLIKSIRGVGYTIER
jgi:DNA-binding response OmpR family regulator